MCENKDRDENEKVRGWGREAVVNMLLPQVMCKGKAKHYTIGRTSTTTFGWLSRTLCSLGRELLLLSYNIPANKAHNTPQRHIL